MRETARNRLVVCYDIRDPNRLRKTHDAMLGYGDPLQYSVFVCDLSSVERLLMEETLHKVSRLPNDSIHIIDLGPAGGRAMTRIRSLGGASSLAPGRHKVL